MTKEQQTYFLKLVRNGNTKEAINGLMELNLGNSKNKVLVGVAAQYQQWEQKKLKGILSAEQENLQQNQITNQLIDFIIQSDQPIFSREKAIPLKVKIPFWKRKGIQLLGIIGSLASIIALYFVFFPPIVNDHLQLTVFVTDTNGNVVLENEGELNIPLGNNALNAKIGEDGRTNFGDIPASLSGNKITIGLNAEGWEISERKNTFVFKGEPIHLKVKRDNSLGIIKGVVKTRDGQEFITGATVLINTDTSIQTDANGIFKIILPTDIQVNNLSTPYLLTVSKEGFKTKSKQYYPKTSDADIRLEKR